MNYFVLKIIAFIFMTIDHIGFGILKYEDVGNLYLISRCLGRIAFPIFCFLLVNGFYHTKNKRKYLIRLLSFSLISEIFFDLCFFSLGNMDYQNVYFTLSIGFVTMWALEGLGNYIKDESPLYRFILKLIFYPVFIGFMASINEQLNGDYGSFGIVLICGIYLVYRGDSIQSKALTSLIILIANIWYILLGNSNIEIFSLLSIIFIFLFKDKKVEIKKPIKIFCYIYYPLHIFIIYLIRIFFLT